MSETKVGLIIEAKDNATQTLKSVEGGLSRLKGNLEAMKPTFKSMAVIGTAAFAAVSATIYSSIKAYADAEQQIASFNATMNTMKDRTIEVISSTDGVTKSVTLTTEAVNEASARFLEYSKSARNFGFDGEDMAVVLGKLYQRTGSATEAIKLNNLAMDLARAKQIGLADAATLVGQVLSGNGKVLKQYGIEISDTATPLEQLAILQQRVGGQAEAFADTLAGKMARLSETVSDVKEAIGGALAPTLVRLIEGILPVLEFVEKWVTENPELAATIAGVAFAVTGLTAVIGVASLAMMAFSASVAPVIIILAGAVAAVFSLIYVYKTLRENSAIAIENLKELWNGFKAFWGNFWDSIIQRLTNVWESIMSIVNKISDAIKKVADRVGGSFSAAGSILKDNVKAAAKAIGINDGIVQNGRVITTHPDDYIIATKTPETLGQGGKGGQSIVVNITGTFLSDDAAEKMGDILISKLQLQMKT